ncbi:late embryogenesis abundant protein 18-like [Carica papaya]|uniref:late embryogenesis abundant protein 18-like n=1 Tax=Carica papaya TaxID=3649 RepID=UPI000B8C8A31|nr:late embryogenesis abundant protein 18-like [Carica papaya]
MQSAKEKISNMASSTKEHIKICMAKTEEKLEKATATTEEQKHIARERRKAKEAQAKMELHQAKAEHAAQKLRAKQGSLAGHKHYAPTPVAASHPAGFGTSNPAYGVTSTGQQPVVSAEPMVSTPPGPVAQGQQPVGTATAVPTYPTTYPLGGQPRGNQYV